MSLIGCATAYRLPLWHSHSRLRGGADEYGESFDDEDDLAAVDFAGAEPSGQHEVEDAPATADAHDYVEPLETEEQFNAALNAAGSMLVVVDFTADWCGPCQKLAPVLEDLAKKYEGRVKFYKVDVPRHTGPGLPAARGVSRLPALQFFRDGKMIDEIIGLDVPSLKGQLNRATMNPLVSKMRSPSMLLTLAAGYAAFNWKKLVLG